MKYDDPNDPKTRSGLRSLFEMMDHEEEAELPDLSFAELKSAVFTTIDVVGVMADVIDLFTVKMAQSQSDIWENVQETDYWNQETKLFEYFERKSVEKTEDSPED